MKKTMNVILAAALSLTLGSISSAEQTFRVQTGGLIDFDITIPESQDALNAWYELKNMATDRQALKEKTTEYLLLAAQSLKTEMLKVEDLQDDDSTVKNLAGTTIAVVMIPSAVLTAYYTLKLGAEYLVKLPGIGIKEDRSQILFIKTSDLRSYFPKDTELGTVGRRIGVPLNAGANVAWRAFRNSPQLFGAAITGGLAIYSAGVGATLFMDTPVYQAFMTQLDRDIANLQQSLDLIRAARH